MDGDKIELTIEKVGTLKFNVKDELKRTWARTTRLAAQGQPARKARTRRSSPASTRPNSGKERAPRFPAAPLPGDSLAVRLDEVF